MLVICYGKHWAFTGITVLYFPCYYPNLQRNQEAYPDLLIKNKFKKWMLRISMLASFSKEGVSWLKFYM